MDTKTLETLIEKYNQQYFETGASEISDPDFDKLVEKLKKLNPDSQILKKLYPDVSSKKRTKIFREKKMLSLDKIYTDDEVKKWCKKIKKDYSNAEFIIQPKYDGMSVEFKNTKLVTRGDGDYGFDVSDKLDFIVDFKSGKLLKKCDYIGVVGEVFIRLSDYEKYYSKKYKNHRNATSGMMNLDPDRNNEIEILRFISHGFKEFTWKIEPDLSNFESLKELIQKELADIPIDGLVIKVNQHDIREELGETDHHPRWAVAFKFDNPEAKTVLKKITWELGRTGKITPLAHVEPITINGYTIKKATLHNYEFVAKNKLGEGAEIVIERSGDVIPHVKSVIKEGKKSFTDTFDMRCPFCDSKLEFSKTEIDLFCMNKACPERVLMNLIHFCSEMEIRGLSEGILRKFMNQGFVYSWLDIYKIDEKKKDLKSIEGFGEKSIENVLESIRNSKKSIELSKFISALGIDKVGKSTAQDILDGCNINTIQELLNLFVNYTEDVCLEKFVKIEGISLIIASSFYYGFKKKIKRVMSFVEDSKINPKFKTINYAESTLKGKSFCITGKLSKSRGEFETLIKEKGGKIAGVSKNLDYLILGELPKEQTNKLSKVTSATKVINEKEFLKLIS